MTEATAIETPEPKKGGKLILIVSLVLALVGGGGGFMAVKMGLLGLGAEEGAKESSPKDEANVAFVAVDPIIVSLGAASTSRHLTFRAQLEVVAEEAPVVTGMLPRVVDVLNSYLRAVDVREFDDPTALIRLRAQMLRRVQMVTGEGRVRDLLIMEFVLN